MFSKTTEYALRATIYIAQKSTGEKKLGIDEITRAVNSPKHFTAKILQLLTRGNIISSVKGPNGGFFITDKQRLLSVKSVLIALDEYVVLEKCVLGLNECSETKPCPMHAQYKLIKPQLQKLFESRTIQSLADDIKSGGVFIKSTSKKKA